MSDLISRQAAIDALWKALFEYEDKMEKQFFESEELDVRDWIQHRIFVQNMSDIDKQTILSLPSAEPERKWIPVNERLPKNEQHVLCAVEWYPDGETNIISGCRYKDGVWETIIEAPLYDYWTELADVLAWMPYPEPYRIGEEK